MGHDPKKSHGLKVQPFAALVDALPKKKGGKKKAKAKVSKADAAGRSKALNDAAKKALDEMRPERRSKVDAETRRAAAAAKSKPARTEGATAPSAASGTPGAAASSPAVPTAPLEGYEYADKAAFLQEFGGVRPLGAPAGPARGRAKKKSKVKAKAVAAVVDAAHRAEDELARSRLGQLVAGGLTFHIERDGDHITGRRDKVTMKTVRLLTGGELAPERSLDLHGRTRVETSRLVRQFVREAHRAGRRTLAIVHGKGTHSALGGVLREAVIEALTKGGAAPLVHAFATAPARLGGEGALLVRLS